MKISLDFTARQRNSGLILFPTTKKISHLNDPQLNQIVSFQVLYSYMCNISVCFNSFYVLDLQAFEVKVLLKKVQADKGRQLDILYSFWRNFIVSFCFGQWPSVISCCPTNKAMKLISFSIFFLIISSIQVHLFELGVKKRVFRFSLVTIINSKERKIHKFLKKKILWQFYKTRFILWFESFKTLLINSFAL